MSCYSWKNKPSRDNYTFSFYSLFDVQDVCQFPQGLKRLTNDVKGLLFNEYDESLRLCAPHVTLYQNEGKETLFQIEVYYRPTSGHVSVGNSALTLRMMRSSHKVHLFRINNSPERER